MSQKINESVSQSSTHLVTQSASQLDRFSQFSQFSQLVCASISQLDNWTVRSITVFALTSVTHNSQSLLQVSYVDSSATALCGTTGSKDLLYVYGCIHI